MVRVGLVGFGLAGQAFHAPIIRAVSGLELACILERHGSLAQQKYPDVRIARSLEDLLADEQIQLCVIATPNASHFDLAQRCLLAGRDVVIDKPITTNSQDAVQLVELAEKKGRVLTVYQNRRFDGDFLTVQNLLASDALGRVVAYESHFDRYRPAIKENAWRERPESGSGILYDLGPHLFDQAMVLFGAPLAINADVFSEREASEVDDAFNVSFEYAQMRAILRASVMTVAPGPRFVIHGTKASFVKYGLDPQEAQLRRGEPPGGPHWGEDPESDWGTLLLPNGDSFVAEQIPTEAGDYRKFYANVRDAIAEGKPLAVPPRDAFRNVRAVELVQQSSRERRTIPWSDFSM
jgi:scyllo-inositol 2-dehydrogenase (NADP+)